MPTPTYTALATRTLTGVASSVTFSNIPATYRDLILVCSGTSANTATASLTLRFNSDAGTNYQYIVMGGTGSGVVTSTATSNLAIAGLTISSSVNVNIAHIMDYSATDKHKTVITRENSMGESYVRSSLTRWINTAAITSILVRVDAGQNLNSGSTFSLYGVIA